MLRPSEAETESEFICPVLDLLRWHRQPRWQPHVALVECIMRRHEAVAESQLVDAF